MTEETRKKKNEYLKKYRNENKEKLDEYNKEYYQKNKKILLQKKKDYYKNEPSYRERKRKRELRTYKKAPVSVFSFYLENNIAEKFKNKIKKENLQFSKWIIERMETYIKLNDDLLITNNKKIEKPNRIYIERTPDFNTEYKAICIKVLYKKEEYKKLKKILKIKGISIRKWCEDEVKKYLK